MPEQPLDLDAIEARANAASAAPWSTHADWPGRVFSDDPFNTHIARITGTRADDNAEFIAHARTDVPALVAEIRRLTADVDMWRRTVTRTEQGRDRAIADNGRLTAELQHAQQRIAAVLALLPDDPEEDINAPFVPLRRIRAAANGQIDPAAPSGA